MGSESDKAALTIPSAPFFGLQPAFYYPVAPLAQGPQVALIVRAAIDPSYVVMCNHGWRVSPIRQALFAPRMQGQIVSPQLPPPITITLSP